MYDGKLALSGGFEEEFLHGHAGGVGQDDFVGVDVFEGVGGDLVVDLGEFVDDFLDACDYFAADIARSFAAAEGGRWAADWGAWLRGVGGFGRMREDVEHGGELAGVGRKGGVRCDE